MATALRSLPGFTFETVTAPLDEALPRMDVAVFVGFAASGPLNVPVGLDQPADFDDIFGPEVTLAWDLARGDRVTAHLSPAVHAFFRNGGRRCWVVRVAGEATANTFTLPGLSVWSSRRVGVRHARASARSEGSWSDEVEAATLMRRQGLQALEWSATGSSVTVLIAATTSLEPRDLLRLTFAADRHRAFGVVQAIAPAGDGSVRVELTPVLWFAVAPGATTPPDGASGGEEPVVPPTMTFAGTSTPQSLSPLPRPTLVEVLHVDLLARRGGAEPQRLERLGLVNGHARYWGALPADAALFAPWADPMAHGIASNRRPAVTPRFPLAGIADADPDADAIEVTIPTVDSVSPRYRGPDPLAASAARRDGLERFDPALFLDRRLRGMSLHALIGAAESIKYQTTREPQLLDGIHAALFIDEATVIAVPDAVHRPWTIGDDVSRPAVTAVPAETAPPDRCAPAPPFEACEPCSLPAPVLHPPEVGQRIGLTWDAVPRATQYVVEEAGMPNPTMWSQITTTKGTSFDVYDRPPGQYAFRVRAENRSQAGPASVGQVVTIPFTPRAIADTADTDSRPLREIQRALLTMCAARGDMVAVLAVPERCREAETIAYVGALTSGSIEPALSYGAVYHPWLITTDGREGAIRRTPPDGAAAGILARRALARGAWVAPANETIRGAVALTPPLSTDAGSRRELLTAQVNVITQEPSGFLTLSADTLSRDRDLRPLNVRRLLILLRRRALQVGSRYVFEPNGPAFVRLVQRGFEDMLAGLYERGAFAGATRTKAYQVVVDEGLNTPQARDAGRFIVELRVAPSWPLTYLRVRLLQRGDRLSATEER